MVGSDAVITGTCFLIPLVIGRFMRQRTDMPHRWLAGLFSAFIFACGTTHLMAIWTVWQPDYAALALAKLVTALISLVTAVALWPLIPRALKIPGVGQLQVANAALAAEVGRRRTAEQQVTEIEQALAVTLSGIEAGFIATDTDGRVTRMNTVAEQVTGWPQAEAQGRSLWQVFERENRPAEFEQKNLVAVMLAQAITVAQPHAVVAIARGGQRTPVEVRAAVTRAEDGTLHGLAMVFRDMTRLNTAEAELHRLAAIVESSFDAIIGMTLDGRITNWNVAAARIYGHTAEQAIGASIQILVPPDCEAEEARILAELAQGHPVALFDTVWRTRDGRHIAVSVTVSPIHDAMGRIVGASKIVRDITQQKLIEESRQRAERLEA